MFLNGVGRELTVAIPRGASTPHLTPAPGLGCMTSAGVVTQQAILPVMASNDDEHRSGLTDTAGRVAFYPARAAARAWRGPLPICFPQAALGNRQLTRRELRD